jgi:hypothetical protein
MVNKNIIEKTRKVYERRKAWAEEYPQFAPPAHREDESMKDAYSFLNLRRVLWQYIEEVKFDSDRSIENIREYRRLDRNVFELTNELDRRLEEDQELSKDAPNPDVAASEKREATQKVIMRELESALSSGGEDSLILLTKEEIDEEAAIMRNPARKFEQTRQAELGRTLSKELKRAIAPKISRPRIEEDSVSEELDTEPETRTPTGRYRDVVGSATLGMHIENPRQPLQVFAEEEIINAMHRLLPVTDDELVKKHKEAFDEYLAKKMDDAYEA